MTQLPLNMRRDRSIAARAARDAGIARAADHADRSSEDWSDRAFSAFVSTAKRLPYFTTEQARQLAPDDLPDPPDKRAWGHVARRAVREGIVERAGFVTADDPRVHCNVVTRWRSCVTGVR